ncbi:MAG: phytoene desaturase [Nitrospirota bacterium]|nr:MAG: phytoene desaturase [Nitrospirota bacterium]
MKTDSILIIGAGIGGLSAAIRLAAAEREVVIFEQNTEPGGKMSRLQAAGFTWDRGPSVITMRPVFEQLFASAGRKLEDYLTLEPVEPLTRYFYPDSTVLNATRDLPRMLAQIRQIELRDVEGYLNFLAYAARLHRITGPVFIYDQPPTWRSFLRVPFRDWFRVDGLRSMDAAIRSYVRSPKLRQFLGRFATYVGASPYQALATLNVIAHVELNEGVWYPRGGVYQIATALSKLADELGVQIRYQNEVEKLIVENSEIRGIELSTGEMIPAKQVISNLDVTTTRRKLLRESPSGLEPEVSGSGFILLLGIAQRHPELAHHNIFFSKNYPREFRQIFREGVPPDDPTIYVAITSKTDPEHAPPGCENWFVQVNAPPTGANYDWTVQAETYRDLLLKRLAERGYGLQPYLRYEQMITPLDLQRETGGWHGALYGASSNSRWSAFRRPHNRAKDVKGLYFVGGSTHPGGGVPMVTLSGKVVAGMILAGIDQCP